MAVRSRKKRNQSIDLPKEIIEIILPKLPFKTILQCKLVCKEFNDVISDARFAEVHYQNPHLSLVIHGKDPQIRQDTNHFFLIERYKSTNKRVNHTFECSKLALLDDISMDCYEVVNSCRGILLLRKEYQHDGGTLTASLCFTSTFVICNPITKDFKYLTKEPELPSKEKSLCGLGFSPRTKEYKIVRLVRICGGAIDRIEILTLGSNDNDWRQLPGYFNFKIRFKNNVPLAMNGALYWLATREEIACFDIDKEEFYHIPSPFGDKKVVSIGVLHGSLGVRVMDVGNSRSGFELWMLNEYGVRHSWSKCYVIENLLSSVIMKKSISVLDIKFVEDCESGMIVFLMETTNACLLMTYDPSEKCIKKVGHRWVNSNMNVQFYVPSFFTEKHLYM